MTSKLLEDLKSDEIQSRACVIAGPAALQAFFASREEIHNLAKAIESGIVSEESVRGFVDALLQDLKQGFLFEHDLTLAALAVALQNWNCPFAEEYLCGLAGLKSAEMPYGPRIARDILSSRSSSVPCSFQTSS